MVPVRWTSCSFAAYVHATFPLPRPVPGGETAIHAALLTAVHEQNDCPVTVTAVPAPEGRPTVRPVEPIAKAQAGDGCWTETVCRASSTGPGEAPREVGARRVRDGGL